MSKPIFVIEIPNTSPVESFEGMREILTGKLSDWHVIVIYTDTKELKCAAFREQAATDIELESFKEMIQNQVKQVV